MGRERDEGTYNKKAGMTKHVYFCWGVMLLSNHGKEWNELLFKDWHGDCQKRRYAGEPAEPLLFTTRRQAEEWAQQQREYYGTYPDGHVCRAWRFRVVRVRKTVTMPTVRMP